MNESKTYTVLIPHLDDLPSAAQEILDVIGSRRIILLHGELGAGKTTLTQQMVSILGHKGSTSSPTYSLINEYEGSNGLIYHMDLYRLNDVDEAYDLGLEDYLFSGQYCFVEWPSLLMDMIEGEPYVEIRIELMEEGMRKVEIVTNPILHH